MIFLMNLLTPVHKMQQNISLMLSPIVPELGVAIHLV